MDSQIEEGGWVPRSPTHNNDDDNSRRELGVESGAESEDEEEEEMLSVKDGDLMSGLLEVMAVLWEVVRDRLEKSANRKIKRSLLAKMKQSLPVFFSTFTVRREGGRGGGEE